MSNLHIINNVHKIKEEVNGVRLVYIPDHINPYDEYEWVEDHLWLEVTTPEGGIDGFSITGCPSNLFRGIRKMLPFVTCTKWEDVARVAVLAAMNVAEAEASAHTEAEKLRYVLDLLGMYYFREGDEAYMNPVHGFMVNFLKGGQDGFNTPPVPEEAIDTFATSHASPCLENKGYRDWDDYCRSNWTMPKGGRKRRFNRGQKDTTPIQGVIVTPLYTIETGEWVTTRSYDRWANNGTGQIRTRWVPGPTVTRTRTRTIRCSSGYRKPKAVKA